MSKRKRYRKTSRVKECRRCKIEKGVRDFPFHYKASGMRHNTCKKCTRELSKMYRDRRGKATQAAYMRKYRQTERGRERVRLTNAKYYKAHK